MSEHAFGRRYPQSRVQPIAPLLRAQTAPGHVAARHEVMLPVGYSDESEVVLHKTESDSESWATEARPDNPCAAAVPSSVKGLSKSKPVDEAARVTGCSPSYGRNLP